MERDRGPREEIIGDKISHETSLPGAEGKRVLIETSRKIMRDYYCALAEHLGYSPEEAKTFFEEKVNFKFSNLNKNAFEKIIYVKRKIPLGYAAYNPFSRNIHVRINPDLIAETNLSCERYTYSKDYFLKLTETELKYEIDFILTHELGHVFQRMVNPKVNMVSVGESTVPYLLWTGGGVGSIFSNNLAINLSLMGTGFVGWVINDHRLRRQKREGEVEANSIGSLAMEIQEKTGIKPFKFTSI